MKTTQTECRRVLERGSNMPEQTYKLIEIVGLSEESIAQAVRNGIGRAGETLKGLDWFEVTEIRGRIREGKVTFQVQMKIGFPVMRGEEMA
jgi:hypothetical protein